MSRNVVTLHAKVVSWKILKFNFFQIFALAFILDFILFEILTNDRPCTVTVSQYTDRRIRNETKSPIFIGLSEKTRRCSIFFQGKIFSATQKSLGTSMVR